MTSNTTIPRYGDKVDPSVLGDQITLPFSGKVAKTRFLKAAMTERQSSWDQHNLDKRGIASQSLIRLYEEWGKGGFGIILSGNTIVNPVDLEAPGNLILSKKLVAQDSTRLEQFRKLASAAKADGSLFVVQLSHGGRQVGESIQPNPVSASDVQLEPRIGQTFAKPTPLTKEQIRQTVNDFADAAELSHQAGADGVQFHGAHGYLIAQFLSSTTNQRTDEYGGSLENRARFLREIIEETKKRVPSDFSLSAKINSVEFQRGGFQPDECKQLAISLESLGLDWIELSGGTYEELAFEHKRESTKVRESFFLEFADVIRPALQKTKVYVTGGFRSASAMIEAVKGGSTDGVGLGRPVGEEPDLPKLILSGEATGARKTLIPDNDFGSGNLATGIAMRQVGEAKTPVNTTDPEQLKQFQAVVQAFFAQSGEDAKNGVVSAGYPVLTTA